MKKEINKDITEKVMVKLAKHEVELGTLQDIDKYIEEGKKFSQQAFESEKKALYTITDSITDRKASLIKYNEALKNANEVIKKMRDIGIDDIKIVDKVEMINRYIDNTNESIKILNQAAKIL